MKPLETIQPPDVSSLQSVERYSPQRPQATKTTEETRPDKVEVNRQKGDQDKGSDKERVKAIVDRLNHMSRVLDRKIQFEVASETEDVVVKIVDRETGQTIRQIPPQELVNLASRMEEIHEIIFKLKL